MDKSKLVAIYVRVSLSKQAEKGYSLEAQEKVLRDEIARQGKLVFKVYKDAGISGAKADRPGLQNLLADAKKGLFGSVGIWMISRLSRNLSDFLAILEELKKADVQLFSIMERFDMNTPVGNFTAQMFGSIAQMQRETIRENALLGSRLRAKSGKTVGGQLLGYINVPDTNATNGTNKLVIEPSEAEVVKKIFNLYCQGYGLKAVAKMMNAGGYSGKNGKSFSIMTIRGILTNKAYIGFVKYDGEYFQGIHEPIISQEQWTKVQNLLAFKRTFSKTIDYQYLLSGIIKCPVCGAGMLPMHVNCRNKDGSEKVYYYYACGQYMNKGAGSCSAKVVKAKEADAEVMNFICGYLCKDEWQDEVIEGIKRRLSINKLAEININQLKGKLRRLRAKRNRLLFEFEEGKLSKEQLLIADKLVQKDMNETEIAINVQLSSEPATSFNEGDIRKAFSILPKQLQNISDVEKAKLIHSAVKAVYVDDNRKVKTIEVYIPELKQNIKPQTIELDAQERR